jgi:single-strand DNA-binding protein
MYLNKALIAGNLTRDPELKSLPTGQKVAQLGIATNRTWKDAQGVKQEATDYHNVTFYGKQAEVIAQYLKKGRGIFVEGRIQTRSWDDKATGEKKYRTEIIGDNFQFMGDKPASSAPSDSSAPQAPQPASAEQFDVIDYPDEDINPEDIPF